MGAAGHPRYHREHAGKPDVVTDPVSGREVRRRDAGQVARLLLSSVRREPWRAPGQEADRQRRAPPEIVAAARFHGVAGYVHRMLKGGQAQDAGTLAALDGLRLGGLHTHLRALDDVPRLASAFGQAGVPWLVVKGPALAELHGAPDLRAYSDLDVLVPSAAFGDALAALESAGAAVLARNWWHRLDVLAGEVPLSMRSGTLVDLHWHS